MTTSKTADLIPYINNARTHSDEQVTQIAASIKEFGFINPVIIDGDNGIIAGHGRIMAAKKLGIEEVPVVEASHLSEAQKKAYILADNKMALNAGWDDELLALEIADLKDLEFDLSLTGFDFDEVKDITGDVEGVGFPELSDGEKEPFQQVTFTLHDDQKNIIDDAMTLAKTSGLTDTGINENSNGNAISYICEQWLNGNS
ncbi:MAG: ParB N-terminal domain-containing protein [Gammaproteobacteria bacterium]|nr:ParB N-terminal domain-containing protein [Gammaproteobacteria bacterium]